MVLVFSQDMPARHRVCALFRDMFGGKQRFRLLFQRAVGFAAGQKRLLERLVARLTEHVVNRASAICTPAPHSRSNAFVSWFMCDSSSSQFAIGCAKAKKV